MLEKLKDAQRSITQPIKFWINKKRYALKSKPIKLSSPSLVICATSSPLDHKLLPCILKGPLSIATDKNLKLEKLNKIKSVTCKIPIDPIEPDAVATRKILRELECKRSVALFFDDACTIQNEKIIATAKLAKLCKARVVFVKFYGTSFVKPYWQKTKNSCDISWKIEKELNQSEVQKLTAKQIQNAFEKAFKSNNENNVEFIRCAKNPAEKIEKTLYFCPECGKISTIQSLGSNFWCSACGDNCTILPSSKILGGHFELISDWQKWQQEYTAEYVKKKKNTDEVLLHDFGWKVFDISHGQQKRFGGYYETFLFANELLIANKLHRILIDIKSIARIKCDYNNKLYLLAKPNTKLMLCPTLDTNVDKYPAFIKQLKDK